MNYEKKFCEKIKLLRDDAKITQKQLGEFVNLSKQAINDIEKGRHATTIEKIGKLADYFNVSIDYLVGRTDNPKINE